MQSKILICGDSILKGVVLDEESGRYILSHGIDYDRIAKTHNLEIVNRSKFGSVITRGEAYLRKALENGEKPDVVLLEYGGNDCDFDWRAVADAPTAEHLPHTPLDVFLSTYERMISTISSTGATPVLVGLPPISATRYLSQIGSRGIDTDAVLTWLGDVNAIYRYQERYANAIAALAVQKNLPFLDLRTPFLAVRKTETLLCADGIHPNLAGQHLLTDALETGLAAFAAHTRIAG